MGKTINQFVAEPFVNKLGQTINPGDPVAYVTHGWKRVRMGKAWFDGVFKNSDGKVVMTRVRGVKNKKYVEIGEVKTKTYSQYDYLTKTYVDKSYQYRDKVKVACEPYGYSILQRNRIIKIEG